MRTPLPVSILVAISLCCALLWPGREAQAQNLIKREGAHPAYDVELEPHLGFDFPDVGLGLRATFNVADRGFISRFNDSVGVGVGADFGVSGRNRLILPVAMQWNFWFTPQWSAFGEPGIALRLEDKTHLHPHLAAGGRLNFNDSLAMTLRLGWPVTSLGVSFFL